MISASRSGAGAARSGQGGAARREGPACGRDLDRGRVENAEWERAGKGASRLEPGNCKRDDGRSRAALLLPSGLKIIFCKPVEKNVHPLESQRWAAKMKVQGLAKSLGSPPEESFFMASLVHHSIPFPALPNLLRGRLKPVTTANDHPTQISAADSAISNLKKGH